MKWLKLDCDFRYDPKVLSLIHQFGTQEACSFWVLLLSYVGSNGMPACEIEVTSSGAHSLNLIASFLGTKPKVALTMLDASAMLALIHAERWRNDRVIYIPNMLKRLDDYTRKVRTLSGQTPDLPPTEQNKNKNKNIDKTLISPTPLISNAITKPIEGSNYGQRPQQRNYETKSEELIRKQREATQRAIDHLRASAGNGAGGRH